MAKITAFPRRPRKENPLSAKHKLGRPPAIGRREFERILRERRKKLRDEEE